MFCFLASNFLNLNPALKTEKFTGAERKNSSVVRILVTSAS